MYRLRAVIASGILPIVTTSAHVPVALGRTTQGFGASTLKSTLVVIQRWAPQTCPAAKFVSWEQGLTGNEKY